MKKILTLIILLISIFSFSINYNIGMTVMSDNNSDSDNPFDLAIRNGFSSNNFSFSFDLSPKLTPKFHIISVMDLSANISNVTDNIFVDAGVKWFNDRSTKDSTQNINDPYIYMGANFVFKNVYSKISFGYPFFQNNENEKLDIRNYLFLKFGFIVPKPEGFLDDLIFEINISSKRRDFSIFFSEPI